MTASGRRPYLTSRLQGFGTTIFAEMSALAAATGSINLGQGFPDEGGPAEVSEAAVEAIRAGVNQYPPGDGFLVLREAIAEHQRRFYGLSFDPDGEVLVTAGATEALAAAVVSLCEPGDEVLMFEPFYDAYAAVVALAGARQRTVRLDPPGYEVDVAALERAITPATRLLLLNSPHNPTGKVFSAEELAAIARVCVERDLIVVTDEVYEHLVFDGVHVPLATLPGMADRTITISSAGKTFSFTGWKIGWACARPELITAVRTVKQFLTYVSGAPFQHAVAVGLGLDSGRFDEFRDSLQVRRDLLCDGLERAGLRVFRPSGTYFVTTDIGSLGEDDGFAFCRSLPERCGVVAVPNSVFYSDPDPVARRLVRFACCKPLPVMEEAVARLSALRS
jgi:N-succinyldiaminopimelate aminotransferase